MSCSKLSGPRASGHWSDGETTALVQAWGQLYLQRNRLSDAEWLEVCGAVNAHRAAAGRRFDRSVVQCRWYLCSLKSQYKKELAKDGPSGWRHFAQLRAFLAGPDDSPPPGYAANMSPASVKEEEEEASGGASGSVGTRTVPAKRKFSSLQDGPPPGPGFPTRMSATVNKEKGKEKVKEEGVEDEEVEEASGGASGSVGTRTVPAKRKFSSLHDILDRSGGRPPGPGFSPRMPATVNKEKKKGKEKVKEEGVECEEVKEEVGRDGPANGAASAGSCPAAVVTKLAEVVAELPALVTKLADVYERVEVERLSVEKGKMEMEWEQRAAKAEAAENLGENN